MLPVSRHFYPGENGKIGAMTGMLFFHEPEAG